jgi:hypothetical protein
MMKIAICFNKKPEKDVIDFLENHNLAVCRSGKGIKLSPESEKRSKDAGFDMLIGNPPWASRPERKRKRVSSR